MSLFRYGSAGISLKALLENPELQTAPNLNSGNNDLKKTGPGVSATPNYGSAFLGPNLWERPNDDNNDLDFEYMDLDEFLTENGIPVDLDDEGEQPPVSLLASALASSPPHQSPNPGGSELRINIDPPSPRVQNPHSPSPQLKMSPKPDNTGLFFPDSPVSQADSDSPLGLCLSPARSPKTIENCFLKGLLEDSPVKEETSVSGKRKRSTIEFEIKPEEVALVTIPVLTSPRAQTIITSPPRPAKRAADDHDNESDNEFSLVAIPGQDNFNPKERRFTEEELKPQPMIKKSKKVFVPDDNKDEKYWNRRKKNNVAAKRSRDARRVKENQIAMRAAFLESQNDAYIEELEALREENEQLKKRLAKYEGSH